MFHLCSVKSTDLSTVFGRPGMPGEESVSPKYQDLNIITLGQKPDGTGNLLFSDRVVDEFTEHKSVPEGYDFIFRQAWGLTINEEILHRVISALREEAYPPMSDYLDAKIKDDAVAEQAYIDACLAVKTKYPKFSF